jgi:hypothetical protein
MQYPKIACYILAAEKHYVEKMYIRFIKNEVVEGKLKFKR